MPIYEFECGDCGSRFEELSSAGAEHAACPDCGGEGRRVLSSFGIGRGPTANQRRRMEDARGVDRGGARRRFQAGLDRARANARRKRGE